MSRSPQSLSPTIQQYRAQKSRSSTTVSWRKALVVNVLFQDGLEPTSHEKPRKISLALWQEQLGYKFLGYKQPKEFEKSGHLNLIKEEKSFPEEGLTFSGL